MNDTTKRVDVERLIAILINSAYRDGDCDMPCMSDQTLKAKAALLQQVAELEAKLAERDAELTRAKVLLSTRVESYRLDEAIDRAEAAERARDEEKQDADKYRALRDIKCCTFTLSRDDGHASNYTNLRKWAEEYEREWYEHVPADELERMKEANTDWCLQVYPNTPVCFDTFHGATLDAAIAAFLAANGG